jgi:hypothetical protein
MADTIFQAGKLTAVYAPVGRRANGELRYRRARFDLLEWAPTGVDAATFILPLALTGIAADQLNLDEPPERYGLEFGYYTVESIVLEQYQGDGSDSWKGLHTFGPI